MPPSTVQLQLSAAEAMVLREVLQNKLHDLAIEINRTDHFDFKRALREREALLERILSALAPASVN